jgi:hypothetical protein
MYAIPGLLALLTFIYVRPQEIFPALQSVPFLYLFVLLAALGWMLDVRLGYTRLRNSGLLWWGVAYFLWSAVTLGFALAGGGTLITRDVVMLIVSCFLFLGLSQGIQTVAGVRMVAVTLLLLTVGLAGVGIDQAFSPLGCVKQDDVQPEIWRPDGRSCSVAADCADSAVYDSSRFRCEHLGAAGTISVEWRVRYRGVMEDPNELAMVLAVALPFSFALFQARRTPWRLLVATGALVLFGLCTIFTKSRSGQIAFLAVLGTYLFRRIGWGGVAAAAVLGAPVMLLGGRDDLGADQSTMERIECWSAALEMFRSSPLVGVGKTQFTEHHYLTAHNSFMLAVAETGLPGLFIFSALVYLAFKATLASSRDAVEKDAPARIWGNALFASLCALMVSAFFLSQTDRVVVWTFFGLAGGLASAARARDPSWKLRFTWRDALLVGAMDIALLVGMFVYTKIKGA